MKIYFAGSITGGREDVPIYEKIIEILKVYGQVLTEHIGSRAIGDKGEDTETPEYIYERDVEWLRQSDVLIVEVSKPSLGVGYEIGLAESLGKKILCLYRNGSEKSLSKMISGNKNLKVITYSALEEIPEILNNFFMV